MCVCVGGGVPSLGFASPCFRKVPYSVDPNGIYKIGQYREIRIMTKLYRIWNRHGHREREGGKEGEREKFKRYAPRNKAKSKLHIRNLFRAYNRCLDMILWWSSTSPKIDLRGWISISPRPIQNHVTANIYPEVIWHCLAWSDC